MFIDDLEIMVDGVGINAHHSRLDPVSTLIQPNPASDDVSFSFRLPAEGMVSLKLYNAFGQEVMDIIHREYDTGSHQIHIQTSDLLAGTYFLVLNSNGYKAVSKLFVVR
jgi:hypothetical protein